MWMRRTRRAMAGAGGAGVLLVMLAAHAGAGVGAVDVIRQQVSFEEDHSVTVDSTVEYILQFIPSGEQAQWPVRLRVSASGGDTSRPVLLTARQTTGAQTWQLPYRAADAPGAGAGAGGDLLFEMQRTLCYDPEQSGSSASGQFTLHVSTAGAAVTVAARADPARDWLLRAQGGAEVSITLTAPRALYYRFAPGEERVRLVAESADDVCAVVGVHNYTCPVAELADTITSAGLHMTVQRSGGVQLSRRQFPSGFFVVALVKASDVDCTGEQEEHPDWLWGAALGAGGDVSTAAPRAAGGGRAKALTFTVKAALSRAQYAAAVAATTLGFLLLYAAFAALVWAQRFDAVRRHVGPKAATAQPDADGGETMVDGTTRTRTRRRRRDSDATFDSVDDDSDSEEEEDSPAPRASPGTPPTARAAAVNVAYSAERVDEGDVTTNDDNTDDVTGTDAMTNHVQNRNENGSNIIDGIRNGHDVVAGNDVGGGTYSPAAEGGAGRGGGAPGGSAPGGGAPGGSAPGVSAPGGGGRAQAEVRAAPFGLPARLRVAALARRRDRTLRARSDRYLHTLYTVALFYTLPVVQFVAAFQIVLNVSGSLDLCYYNFLCAHPLGALSDFNHVFSNAGYLLLGALFLLQVRRRRARRRRAPLLEGYGLPAHYGLLSSLGAGMMVVAMLSASYHICPNALNFQFDVAFMYVLAALAMVKMYQARHPDINARAHHTFAALALLIALVVWGVLGGGALFWGVCTALHVFAVLLLSLRIYYVGQFTLDGSGLAEAARGLARPLPLYAPRLVMLLIANAVNWAFALYGLITMPADFATHLLMVLLMNTLLYMVFYIVMKLVCGERLRWYAWGFLGAAAAAWAPALYLFLAGSTSWAATPAHSRHLNHECRLLHFYDNHDLWHMLSALALYLSFNAMLTWDDGLSAVKRSEIAVF